MITNLTVVQGIALQPGPQGPPGVAGAPGSITNLDTARGWTTVQWTVPNDLTFQAGGTTTWDVSVYPNARLALSGGNTTMALLNVVEGAYYSLRTDQDTGTFRTITWGASQGFHWPSATPVQPTARNNAIDLWHFRGAPTNVLEFAGAQLDLR